MRPNPHNLRLVAQELLSDLPRIAGWNDISDAEHDLMQWLRDGFHDTPPEFTRRLRTQLRPDLSKNQNVLTTNDLVDVMTAEWNAHQKEQPAAFSDWKEDFDSFCTSEHCTKKLPSNVLQHLPLREEVAKLVYASITGRMPFSREYVLKHYEREFRGKPYVLFPSEAPCAKRLVILFSGHSGRKTYNRYSWYWDETEQWASDTARLFLCDEGSHWYVGEEGSQDIEVWKNLITSTMEDLNISPMQVVTVGGSMGGYAAIRYAIELNLRAAIAVNPQLDFRSALRYKEISWEQKIREAGSNFQDIASSIYRRGLSPIVYLEHGRSACDLSGVSDVLQAIRDVGGVAIERTVDSFNHQTDNPTRDQIEVLLDFVERFGCLQ